MGIIFLHLNQGYIIELSLRMYLYAVKHYFIFYSFKIY